MLVLTRRLEQSIAIGNPLSPTVAIEVIVLEVRGDQVRLHETNSRGIIS